MRSFAANGSEIFESGQKFQLTWSNIDLKVMVSPDGKYFQKKTKELHLIKNLSGYA